MGVLDAGFTPTRDPLWYRPRMHPLISLPGPRREVRAPRARMRNRRPWWFAILILATLPPAVGTPYAAAPTARAATPRAATPTPRSVASTPAPAASAGPTLFVPRASDSVAISDAVPLTVPGRTSLTDTLDAEFHRRAEEQYELAMSLEQQGVSGTAIVAYRNALRIDPTMREANYRMGLLFLKSDQVQAALECFGKEVQHHPDHRDAQREFGLTLARAGQGELAVAHLTKMVTATPNDGASWHALGYAYLAAKRPNDAERALRHALTIPPDESEKHRDLGAVLASLGRGDEARAEYHRALAMTPIDPSTWYNLGNLERHDGRPDSAIAAYRRAERADSLFRPAWQMETQTLIDDGRKSEAAETYRRWLGELPEDHGARMSAIRLFTELDRPADALGIAHDGVRFAAGDAEAHEILGTTLAAQGHWRAALEEIRQAETMFQGDPQRMPALDAVVAHLRASAPDSLRTWFAADSVATARRRAAYAEMRKHPRAKIDGNGN